LDEYNAQYRQLITLNNLIGLMSELFVTVGFAHGKVATSFLESLGVTSGSTVLLDLGKLHRSSILANITLKLENPVEGFKIKSRDRSHLSLAEQVSSPIVEVPRPSQSRDLNALGLGSTATDGAASISWPQWKTDNFASVRYVATQFSIFLTPFFQCEFSHELQTSFPFDEPIMSSFSSAVGKMLLFRRMEPSHKAAAQPTARQMASVLLEHLEVGVSGMSYRA
jgi:E3 ubiquitin-protein ligase HUWE1